MFADNTGASSLAPCDDPLCDPCNVRPCFQATQTDKWSDIDPRRSIGTTTDVSSSNVHNA